MRQIRMRFHDSMPAPNCVRVKPLDVELLLLPGKADLPMHRKRVLDKQVIGSIFRCNLPPPRLAPHAIFGIGTMGEVQTPGRHRSLNVAMQKSKGRLRVFGCTRACRGQYSRLDSPAVGSIGRPGYPGGLHINGDGCKSSKVHTSILEKRASKRL